MTMALHAELTPGSLRILRPGHTAPLLTQSAQPDKRPYIHPILAPDGIGALTENEPGHHLWQHGLYTGLNDVNGAGFWTEGLHKDNVATDGSFHPRAFGAPRVDGTRVFWDVDCEWRSPQGGKLLEETQSWRFEDHESYFLLDLTWTLVARTDVAFGQYAYGGLFLRMPFREGCGGAALDSEGRTNSACEAQRARWVSISMAIPGREKLPTRECGIALFDHPANPEHPVPWRVDGQLGVAPSTCIAGAWKLERNEQARFWHRLFIFLGRGEPKRIEAEWQRFANS